LQALARDRTGAHLTLMRLGDLERALGHDVAARTAFLRAARRSGGPRRQKR
jgi:hypothetical protein